MSLAKPDVRFIGPVMGRYTLESRIHASGVQIFACRLQSISTQMMVASAPVTGSLDEYLTAHFVPFGTLHGNVSRHVEGGFSIEFDLDADEREKLAAKINWYKRRTFAGITDKREYRRFMPREPRSAVVLPDGSVLPCLVIDMSASGAAISADCDPEIGAPLAVGKAVARVVRKLDVGFAVRFVEALSNDIDIVEDTLRAPDEWERAMRQREVAAAAELAALADRLEAAAEPEGEPQAAAG